MAEFEDFSTPGDDTLFGTAGDDSIRGGEGNDFIAPMTPERLTRHLRSAGFVVTRPPRAPIDPSVTSPRLGRLHALRSEALVAQAGLGPPQTPRGHAGNSA